jgi:RHS repeat-associated protein
MVYNPARAHQLASTGSANYNYDDNGNLTRIVDSRGRVQRTITRDADDRAIEINDTSNSTDYSYDHLGLMGVRRDGLGETAFVNDWFQTVNQGWAWRQIWAGESRIAQATEHLDELGNLTQYRYYQHEDLQGTTNLVTDAQGLVFEHIEYFPSGELWIHENSTTHRTPYRFVGAFNDEFRNLHNLGQRWYEPREQMFYNPEPLLYKDPQSVIGDPGLLPAYSYAESNPLRLYDNDGLAGKNVQSRLANKFGLSEKVTPGKALQALSDSKRSSRLWQSLVRFSISEKADTLAAISERFEAKPLLEFELDVMGGRPKLKSVSGGFLIWQKPLKEWGTTAAQSGAAGPGATGQQASGGSAAPGGAAGPLQTPSGLKKSTKGAPSPAVKGTSKPVAPSSAP